MEFEQASQLIPRQLSALLKMDPVAVQTRAAADHRFDLAVEFPSLQFLIEYKSRSNAESIGAALDNINRWTLGDNGGIVTLVAVPHMGRVGMNMCASRNANWIDLSGNALINAPGLVINVSGKPNRYKKRGRPQNVFASKASRVARALITQPENPWSNRRIEEVTGLSKGYVSRVLKRMTDAGFIERRNGEYLVSHTERMLDAWAESYEIDRKNISEFHFAERSPEDVLDRLAALGSRGIRIAATGLSAAWYYTEFAGYRLCSVYASPIPDPDTLYSLDARPVESGANAWLIHPDDDHVFKNSTEAAGIEYVSPLQVYLDLQSHPERSKEAASRLKQIVLHQSGQS